MASSLTRLLPQTDLKNDLLPMTEQYLKTDLGRNIAQKKSTTQGNTDLTALTNSNTDM